MRVPADTVLRRFLLGRIEDEERQHIETLFVTDAAFNERLLAVEQDLIDDYFEGALSVNEQESFRRLYASTLAEQKELAVSKSVKDWANSQLPDQKEVPSRFKLRRAAAIAIVASLVVAVAVLVIWTKSQRDRQFALEREVAQLNTRDALAQPPIGMRSVAVSPVATRTAESDARFSVSGVEVVELRLLWIQPQIYPSYRAEVVGLPSPLKIENLPPDEFKVNLIRVRLPVHLLSASQLKLTLTGVASDGSAGLSDEYNFTVQ